MTIEDLSGPEQIIIERLAHNEPLGVINAWLIHNGYNIIDDETVKRFSVKHRKDIKNFATSIDSDAIFQELIDVKDQVIAATANASDPKAIAVLSNSLNSISKTIDGFVEKKKASHKQEVISPEDFIKVLEFLKSEGFLDFKEDKINELRGHLSGSVSKN